MPTRFHLDRSLLAIAIACLLASCSGGSGGKVEDPIGTLNTPGRAGREYLAAMSTADRDPSDEAYKAALKRIVVSPNYVVEARRAAYARLYETDRDALKRTLEVNYPKLEALEWRRELAEKMAADNWQEMTPTLIRAWAQPLAGWILLGKERPERLALVTMYGEAKLVDVLLKEMAEANPITQANLRARCWELLLLEGQEERLGELLADEGAIGKDAMLLDIRAGVVDLGVLPRTREEILWLRTLREPANAAYWADAKAAVATLPPSRRGQIELRDIGILVAAAKHRPELLAMDDDALDALIVGRLGGSGRKTFSPDFSGYNGGNVDVFSERYESWDEKLAWGDRIAIAVALDAMASKPLVAHVFECADSDLSDKSTEHGGIIELDGQARFELVEYPSRTRGNDARYEAPQELMNDLYTGLFHVHMHAQAYDNRRYAGPHMGDFLFADATRANCLVFAFVDSDRLNVDFYRHGRVVVDLGTISRP